MLALFRFLSLPELRRHPLRVGLTVLGVALGVTAFVAVSLVNDSTIRGLRRVTAQIAGRAQLVVSGDRTGVPDSVLDRVRKVPGVRNATPLIHQVAAVKAVDGRPARGMLQLFGVDTLDPAAIPDASFRPRDLVIDDPVVFLEQPRSLLVSWSWARRHGITGRAGRVQVRLATSVGVLDFTVRGYLRSDGVERIFGGHFALMDVKSAAKVFGLGDRYDLINVLLPSAATPAQREATRQRIAAAIGPGFEVAPPWDRNRQSERVIATWQQGLSLVSFVVLLLGLFLVYNIVSTSVAERRREVGILRALGATRARVVALFAGEALAVGAIGSALGVLGGAALSRALLRAMSDLLSSYVAYADLYEVYLSPQLLGAGLSAGCLGAVLAALGPAVRAAWAPPLDALRPAGLPISRRSRAGILAAAGLGCLGLTTAGLLLPAIRDDARLAPGLVLGVVCGFVLLLPLLVPWLGRGLAALARRLGAVGHVAAAGLREQPRRAVVPVAAMMIAFGLVLSSATMSASFKDAVERHIERTIPADVLVTATTELYTPSSLPMSPALANVIRAEPGVAEVQPLRFVNARVGGRRADLLALDVRAWSRRAGFSLVEGDRARLLPRMVRGEGVAVSENFANQFHLHAGDRVTLRTPHGPRTWPILGVFVDYSSPFGLVVLDRAVFLRVWGDQRVDSFHVYVKPGVDPRQVRAALDRKMSERYDVFVLTNADAKRKVRAMVQESYAIVDLQELIALLVALLGLATALLVAVLRRRREIGVLRAVGATRRQIMAGIAAESALLGVAGAVLGLALGTCLGWVNLEVLSVLQTGWRVEFVFPARTAVEITGLALGVGLVAAWLPARRAARSSVASSLAYE